MPSNKIIVALIQILGGSFDVYIDDKKTYTLKDDEIWLTMPKLAQEQSKGKKVKFVQNLDDGTKIEYGPGNVMDKLLGIYLPPDDQRRLESKPRGNALI